MKKLIKLFLLSMWIYPMIMNANVEEEVTKENIIKLEENIHYEKDVENICEYYDKNNYIIGDWIYTFEKPEEKEYREIVKEVKELNLDRNIINILKITAFDGYGSTIDLYELAIRNKDGNKLDYEIKNLEYVNVENIEDDNEETFVRISRMPNIKIVFNEPQYTKNIVLELTYSTDVPPLNSVTFSTYLNEELFTNAYDNSITSIENDCIDNLCHMKITINEEKMYKEDISIRKTIYKFRDKYYKCYTPKTIDLNEYINNLGYIKKTINNETIRQIEENKNTVIDTSKNTNTESKVKITEEKKPQNVLIEEIQENVNKENEKLAILTKESKENSKNYTEIYIITFILLSLIIIGIIFTKRVIKCRTK